MILLTQIILQQANRHAQSQWSDECTAYARQVQQQSVSMGEQSQSGTVFAHASRKFANLLVGNHPLAD